MIYKCKMCGGQINVTEKVTVAKCPYCKETQTFPQIDDEIRNNLFNRANELRLAGEFDKSALVYERLIEEGCHDSEVYWGLVLCKYGIEYVEDYATHRRLPTCHRVQYESIASDTDFRSAYTNADAYQQQIYLEQAKDIARIQKAILKIAKEETPYDVFICYKETDEYGRRTIDSQRASELYYELTKEGFKVFYSAVTLENHLGEDYEPYIFAALNSAKVMLVVGTKPEHYNAVWVKNEWSRFIKMTKTDHSKKIIPCYADMDPYNLPEEFAHLQAQDMSKIGFVNDIVRGIKKVVEQPKTTEAEREMPVSSNGSSTASLLERAYMFLEDGDWQNANEYCEKVLDIEPKNASAYLGKLMSELKVRKQEALKNQAEPFDARNNCQKAGRFDAQIAKELADANAFIRARNENERKDAVLSEGKAKMCGEAVSDYETAIKLFRSIPGWQDADEQICACQKKIGEIKAKEEATRLKAEQAAKKRKKKFAVGTSIVCAIITFVIVLNTVIIPAVKYKKAVVLVENHEYEQAISVFESLDDYKDSKEQIQANQYQKAVSLAESHEYEQAVSLFDSLDDYKDSKEQAQELHYSIAADAEKRNDLRTTVLEYRKAGIYKDAKEKAKKHSQSLTGLLAAGDDRTVGLRADGTVVATGENNYIQRNVDDWTDIAAITAGYHHAVGLRTDGTVVATGNNGGGQCDVDGWTDIVAIAAGDEHTVGLRADGTVVATKHRGFFCHDRCAVDGWTDIVAIAAGYWHSVGLRADGTVVATGNKGDGQCAVDGWTDIVAIAAGYWHTVGLRADGTVVATGDNDDGRCAMDGWTDIVAIAAGNRHTVGLRADGTVVATGDNDYGQCDVDGWTDIVAIAAGDNHTVGLRSDGTVVATGDNGSGQCDVDGWKNINLPSADGTTS